MVNVTNVIPAVGTEVSFFPPPSTDVGRWNHRCPVGFSRLRSTGTCFIVSRLAARTANSPKAEGEVSPCSCEVLEALDVYGKRICIYIYMWKCIL